MYIRFKSSKRSKNSSMQIVESVRVGKQVKQRVVASLGVAKDRKRQLQLLKLAENLITKLQEQGLSVVTKIDLSRLSHTFTEYDGFATVVNRLMELTQFSSVLQSIQGKHSFSIEEAVRLIITQQFDCPSSKRRAYERQQQHGFSDLSLQHLYRAMDAIEPHSDAIQKQAFATVKTIDDHLVDCFFFDVTTLYFESVEEDDLKSFGFSKDQKHHSVQIVLALVVNNQGIPLAYETFKGNMAETKTLIPVLSALKQRFTIQNVIVVCDRGLASKTNVQALQEAGFHFVIATKLRAMSDKLKLNDLSTYVALNKTSNVDNTLFRTLEHPQYKDTLLIATYNPSRAFKDKTDRERLLEKLREKLGNGAEKSAVKKVISNSGYKKFTTVKEGSAVSIDEEMVQMDASWDGFHGIAVSHSANLSPQEALSRYRELWHIEETFRIAKTTLRARPMFHWTPPRIKAHILICFMSLFLERYLEYFLKKQGTPLTPDKIRHALYEVHTMHFQNIDSVDIKGKMESTLSLDAQEIFRVLAIPFERKTGFIAQCSA